MIGVIWHQNEGWVTSGDEHKCTEMEFMRG